MKKAIITVGCSASGKSSFAKDLCENDKTFVEVNRDLVRFNGEKKDWATYKFNKANESRVTEICNQQINNAIENNKNIIVSDTNLNNIFRNILIDKLESNGYEVELKIFDVEFEELLKRDNNREGGVGYEVLLNQYVNFQRNIKGIIPVDGFIDLGKENCYICDLDGAIADNTNRKIFDFSCVDTDTPIFHVVTIVKSLIKCGHKIVFVSGRDDICNEQTEHWLKQIFNLDTVELFMRKTGDKRKDYIVKMEIFDEHIRNTYNVLGCFDDRKQVIEQCWNVLGLKTIFVGDFAKRF